MLCSGHSLFHCCYMNYAWAYSRHIYFYLMHTFLENLITPKLKITTDFELFASPIAIYSKPIPKLWITTLKSIFCMFKTRLVLYSAVCTVYHHAFAYWMVSKYWYLQGGVQILAIFKTIWQAQIKYLSVKRGADFLKISICIPKPKRV